MEKAKAKSAKIESPQPQSKTKPRAFPKPLRELLWVASQVLTPDEIMNITKDKLISAGFAVKKKEFDETKNPVHVLEAFFASYMIGRQPDPWVMDFVAEAFLGYLAYDGKESLDSLFGLKRGRGKTPPMKEDENRERDSRLMVEMDILNYVFGFSIEEAAYMMAERIKAVAKETGEKMFTADTLQSMWTHDWAENFNKHRGHSAYEKVMYSKPEWTEETKRAYLKRYPEHSLPTR